MIQTEVKSVGENEYVVHALIPQDAYDKVYHSHLQKISTQAKLPGFRAGKLPAHVVEQQFGERLREETASELIQAHYVEAMESSKLAPAMRPELEVPAIQPATGFTFTLKVVTWPDITLAPLKKLALETLNVSVNDDDIQSVVDRLMRDQVRYESKDDHAAADKDQVTIDFEGFIGDTLFDGGQGTDVNLVLGSGQFLPDFEQALVGAKTGEERTFPVSFPEDYSHAPLAGKQARFEVKVNDVGVAVCAKDETELADMLHFDDVASLRSDVQKRLNQEAEQGEYKTNSQAMWDALLAANDGILLPAALVQERMRDSEAYAVKSMQKRGVEVPPEMFKQDGMQQRFRDSSQRSLKIALLLQEICAVGELAVSDEEVDAELEQMASGYSDEDRKQFQGWIRGQKEEMDAIHDKLLEKKCLAFIMDKVKVKKKEMSLSEWQDIQDKENESEENT